MESIGDFALNIIPNIDTIKLYSGITALDSLTNIADKVFKVFKGAYGVVDDTADKLRDLAYIGRELNMPVEQIKVMENTMKKFGLNSEQAANALKSIAKFRGGAPFGEFDTDLILKAGLLPTDFGKDPLKNLELLSQKYTSTDNINVRSSIAKLVGPDLERMLTDPARLRQYYLEAQKQTNLSGVNFGEIEKYGKSKGDFSIALDNLAIAMSNAALPGLTQAIIGLTDVLNSPEVRAFFTSIGNVISGSLDLAGAILKPSEETTKAKQRLLALPAYIGGYGALQEMSLPFHEAVRRNFDVKSHTGAPTENAQQYLNTKFNVYVTTDGTAADVKIEQDRYKTNINRTQNTNKTQRVGN